MRPPQSHKGESWRSVADETIEMNEESIKSLFKKCDDLNWWISKLHKKLKEIEEKLDAKTP